MHILLTDVLTCPRCGPAFGLILLADRAESRRIIEGSLGCANCREKYDIRESTVRFAAGEPPDVGHGDADEAMRLGALMGVTGGPGYLLLCGPAARHAGALAELLEDLEVIAVGMADRGTDEVQAADVEGGMPRVNLLSAGRRLPLATARMAGVVLSGQASERLLEEGARVLSPLGRLVLLDAPADAAERLAGVGLRTIASDDRTMIAARR
jgi:uncharacterized protein YbaR (Trm112 family)